MISGGMGEGLMRRLEAQGIDAVVTSETNPDTAVVAYLAGTLPRGEPEAHAHDSSARVVATLAPVRAKPESAD